MSAIASNNAGAISNACENLQVNYRTYLSGDTESATTVVPTPPSTTLTSLYDQARSSVARAQRACSASNKGEYSPSKASSDASSAVSELRQLASG
ncbi:MAG TPA: hypothetical protein VEJ87_10940 [Acidimicrobiales bacterium]|nr:hypothetical protein [Acidimicrobiales bacterium]